MMLAPTSSLKTFVNKVRDEKQIRLYRLKACRSFYLRANSFSKFIRGLNKKRHIICPFQMMHAGPKTSRHCSLCTNKDFEVFFSM